MKQNNILNLFQKVKNNFSYGEIYHCVLLLQKQKPHINIDSILFTENQQHFLNEDYYVGKQEQKQSIIYFKVYDQQERQEKCLKVYFLERLEYSLNLNQLQQLCLASKVFQRSDLILQIYDSYTLVEEDNTKLYFIIEQEVVYSELKNFVNDMSIHHGEKIIIEEIINEAVNYCLNSWLINCQKDVKLQHMQFYIAKHGNQVKIKLNLANTNVFQCFLQDGNLLSDLQSDQDLNQAQQIFLDNQELLENLPESLALQISSIKDKYNITPALLIQTISELVPNLINYHGIQILNIISQDNSYQSFQLEQYDQNYFTFKVLKDQKTFILKAQRIKDLQQAEKLFEIYENLSQFTFFVKIEDKKIQKVENFYYLIILEHEVVVRDQFQMLNSSFDELDIFKQTQYLTLANFIQHSQVDYQYIEVQIRKILVLHQLVKDIIELYQNKFENLSINFQNIYISAEFQSNKIENQVIISNPFFKKISQQKEDQQTAEDNIHKILNIFRQLLQDLSKIIYKLDSKQLEDDLITFLAQIQN
ncbi:hypothetical protein ABPG74_018620 [Tetrahymena malaccensis]